MISYIGGKARLGTWIRNYIPSDIETYVEPFSGAFWVFFKLHRPNLRNLKKVVYNDVNPLNVNLFLCIREDYNKLYEISKNTPIENKELFDQFKSDLFDIEFQLDMNNPNYEIAYKYTYILSQVWSGTDPRRGSLIKNGGYTNKSGEYKSKFEIFRSKLVDPKWQSYFDLITDVECMDFEEVIKKYDSPKTYFYCDPPYYKTEDYYINHDFGIDTHERLYRTLNNIDGKFGLSYYHFEQLDDWYPFEDYKWVEKEVVKSAGTVSGKSPSKGTELLIMNY